MNNDFGLKLKLDSNTILAKSQIYFSIYSTIYSKYRAVISRQC